MHFKKKPNFQCDLLFMDRLTNDWVLAYETPSILRFHGRCHLLAERDGRLGDQLGVTPGKLPKEEEQVGRFVLLSGPSCVGKGPLHATLKRFYPELWNRLQKLVLYNSRAPRPGEQDGIDYHFRPRSEIEDLREQTGFIVMDVRGDLQALNLEYLQSILDGEKDAFFEGNPFVPMELLKSPLMSEHSMLSVFLSPLSYEEILYLRDPARGVSLPDFLTDMMRRKLLRRTKKQKGVLSIRDMENIERRASSAYRELTFAWRFDYVIPTHDGEDSENWDAFYYPVGDARKAMIAFASILRDQKSDYVEEWQEDLLPCE
jgi:guanylate kinase